MIAFLRRLPPVYFLVSLGVMAALDRAAPVARFAFSPVWGLAAAVPAVVLIAWSAALFARARTPLAPHRDATTLVATGPYRWSRNPIYLGLLLILIAFWLACGSLTSALVPPVFVFLLNRNVIVPEETALEARFGDAYRHYKTRVRRWL